MLYDPKWEKKTKADPLSVAAFADWLETKDPSESYRWASCQGCLVDQYLQTIGLRAGDVSYDTYNIFEGGRGGSIALMPPHTFGAALIRARKHLNAKQ